MKINFEMNRQFLIYFLPLFLSLSCSDPQRQINSNQENTVSKNPARIKSRGSFSDTIKIKSFSSAVFYYPDSVQLEKIKAITDKRIFESTMHDYFYQMRYSRIVLKKYYPQIDIIEVKKGRYLLFDLKGGQKEYIDLNAKNDACGLFIFDGQKAPRLVDMTNLDSELGFYFPQSNSLSMHFKDQ